MRRVGGGGKHVSRAGLLEGLRRDPWLPVGIRSVGSSWQDFHAGRNICSFRARLRARGAAPKCWQSPPWAGPLDEKLRSGAPPHLAPTPRPPQACLRGHAQHRAPGSIKPLQPGSHGQHLQTPAPGSVRAARGCAPTHGRSDSALPLRIQQRWQVTHPPNPVCRTGGPPLAQRAHWALREAAPCVGFLPVGWTPGSVPATGLGLGSLVLAGPALQRATQHVTIGPFRSQLTPRTPRGAPSPSPSSHRPPHGGSLSRDTGATSSQGALPGPSPRCCPGGLFAGGAAAPAQQGSLDRQSAPGHPGSQRVPPTAAGCSGSAPLPCALWYRASKEAPLVGKEVHSPRSLLLCRTRAASPLPAGTSAALSMGGT